MELDEALSQITEIRQQMARSSVFRGYRSVTTAFSGLLALATAVVQVEMLPEPALHPKIFVLLWTGAAVLSLVVVAVEILLRARRSDSALQRALSVQAIEQFTPCLVAGGLLTAVLARYVPHACWMLPGLWAILFGLGVLASGRVLPRPLFWVGGFYLLAGVGCLMLAQGPLAFCPWAMALPFGGGQLLAAAILYWTLECDHANR